MTDNKRKGELGTGDLRSGFGPCVGNMHKIVANVK